MKIINPTTGWIEIVKIPTYEVNEVTGGNDELMDKSSVKVSWMLTNKWLIRYPRAHKVVFYYGYEFK